MGELTLVINQPDGGNFLQKIGWNKQEIMDTVASITKQYEGLTYTDEQMVAAKKDRATLNSLKKAISDRRIEVKKAILAPYDAFEAEVKEVVALIDKPIAMIDKQTAAYEEKLKVEKKQKLIDFFNENIGELEGVLTFDMIFSQKWMNRATSMKACKEEILTSIKNTETDLAAIDTLIDEKYRPYAKDFYFRNSRNMTAVLNEVGRMKAIDRKAEEEKAVRDEAERLRIEKEAVEKTAAINASAEPESVQKQAENAQKPAESVQNPPESVQKPEESVQNQPENAVNHTAQGTDPFADKDTDTRIYKASFTIRGTKAQILSVKEFMINNNIKFGKVEK